MYQVPHSWAMKTQGSPHPLAQVTFHRHPLLACFNQCLQKGAGHLEVKFGNFLLSVRSCHLINPWKCHSPLYCSFQLTFQELTGIPAPPVHPSRWGCLLRDRLVEGWHSGQRQALVSDCLGLNPGQFHHLFCDLEYKTSSL